MPTYDDQKSDTDKFDDIIGQNYKPGEADQIEKHAQDQHAKDSGVSGPDTPAGSDNVASKDELARGETAASTGTPQESENEEADTDDGTPKKRGFRGWSRRKKVGIGLVSILMGGGAGGLGLLMILSPIAKVETTLNSIDSYYGAANNSAIDTATENALNGYLVKKVFPGLGQGNCHTTRDPSCTATASDASNPIGALYNAWRESHLEQKLANDYGLVFGRKGDTLYINFSGKDIDLKNGGNIWDSADTRASTKSEIRQAIRTTTQDETLYKRFYVRYKIGKLAEQKFGVKRCVFKCDLRDKFTDSIDVKQKAAKALLIRRVIGPFSQNTAVALQCVLDGNCNFDPDSSHDITDDNQVDRRSEFSSKIQTQVDQLALRYGSDTLKDLANQVDAMGQDGVAKYAFRATLSKILGKEITSEAVDKVATPFGWINFAAQIITFVNDVGPKVKKITFALSSTMAVQTYMMYATAGNEARAGQTDLTQFGSLSDTLTTASVDDNGNSADMTATPMYQEIINRGTGLPGTGATALSLFDNRVSAASTANVYPCNDGEPLPAGERACPEENTSGGNAFATAISEGAKKIPLWDTIHTVAALWKSTIGWVGNAIGGAVASAFSNLPLVKQLMEAVAGWVTPLFQWVATSVLPNLLGSLTGGRIVDVLMIGSEGIHVASANTQLGAGHVSDADMATARTAYLSQQQQDFQSKSLYARLFDTNSPNSLVTQMAAAMPTKTSLATTMGNMARNPFGNLSNAIFSALTPGRAFAAATAQPDPWGMPQVAILPSQIPSDVDDTWWPKNCPDDYVQKFLDSQTEDEATGMMIADKANPCFVYKTVSQVAGAKYNPALLPKDAASTGSSTTGTTGGTTIPTGDTITLAKQIMAQANDPNGNITFQNPQKKAYFQSIVDTGHAKECGAPLISPKLLGVILTLSQNYKLVLGVFDDGHNNGPNGLIVCDSGFHPKGSAVDINGVNPINGGAVGTGNQLHFDSGSMPIVREFYQKAGEVLAANGGGGLGQYGVYNGRQCFAGTLPPKVSGVTYFADSCDHIHLDTRGQ